MNSVLSATARTHGFINGLPLFFFSKQSKHKVEAICFCPLVGRVNNAYFLAIHTSVLSVAIYWYSLNYNFPPLIFFYIIIVTWVQKPSTMFA